MNQAVQVKIKNHEIDTISNGEYYYRNHAHYIFYEEKQEEFADTSKSCIKIKNNKIELSNKGLIHTNMVFEEGKTTSTIYTTPYGQMLLEIKTQYLSVKIEDTKISITIKYDLLEKDELISSCQITIVINEKTAC